MGTIDAAPVPRPSCRRRERAAEPEAGPAVTREYRIRVTSEGRRLIRWRRVVRGRRRPARHSSRTIGGARTGTCQSSGVVRYTLDRVIAVVARVLALGFFQRIEVDGESRLPGAADPRCSR